eukprot:PhM_4_TR16938/c0_g1_i1/m.86382
MSNRGNTNKHINNTSSSCKNKISNNINLRIETTNLIDKSSNNTLTNYNTMTATQNESFRSSTTLTEYDTGGLSAQSIPGWHRGLFFCALVYLQIMCNFDSGALAAILGTRDLGATKVEEGWLASAVYLGHIAGCLFTGSILNHPSLQRMLRVVIVGSMWMTALCAYGFACSRNFWVMLLCRCLSGTASALLVVYCPLWVDDYAPPGRTTLWMSVLQVGVPLGVVAGYLSSGLVLSLTSLPWNYAFYLQALLLSPSILLLMVPDRVANLEHVVVIIDKEEKEAAEAEAARDQRDTRARSRSYGTNVSFTASSWAGSFGCKVESVIGCGEDAPNEQQLRSLMHNTLWLACVFCLCSLYFVVTGLQLWATAYLTAPEPIHASMTSVVAAFGLTCVTGPTLGVIAGGVLMDVSGGYSGNMLGATRLAALCGVVAVGCSFGAMAMTSLMPFIAFVWVLLVCGGAVVPIMTGLSIACVPKELRNGACSIAAVMYNLFGYFLGPLVCGLVSHADEDGKSGIQFGMQIVLGWSVVSLVCITCAWYIVQREPSVDAAQAAPVASAPGSDAGDDDETPLRRPSLSSGNDTTSVLLQGSCTLRSLLAEPISSKDVRRSLDRAVVAPLVPMRRLHEAFVTGGAQTDEFLHEAVRSYSVRRPVRVVSMHHHHHHNSLNHYQITPQLRASLGAAPRGSLVNSSGLSPLEQPVHALTPPPRSSSTFAAPPTSEAFPALDGDSTALQHAQPESRE